MPSWPAQTKYLSQATTRVDAPPKVTGPVVNVEVTVEPSGGRPSPSGRAVLARLP